MELLSELNEADAISLSSKKTYPVPSISSLPTLQGFNEMHPEVATLRSF
jgi:hypothetical protein